MIRYSLKCAQAHEFESWFQSATAFDALRAAGHVTCAICGSKDVEKLLMAPAVRPARAAATAPAALSQPETDVEQAIAALRAQVEANSEYVGLNFAAEARKMHDGVTPERAIYGEAKPEEAKKLIEDGVPVAPLPFLPKRKAN
ncbi:MAG: DUF1178 family protein [Pseudotabrizicola sp.]|uniref:DUF1178 family protein n=1 Tax=Pseudotabrizicola sp. TaxID=2939647 RepID=UPI002725BED6|nr:DUF1178 family protein [Pseudotabrizicola sp.]MDO8884954.1 DUF1178 family protein [Pseudotabrizicola sp.]MDP2080445.1 DUF1178 family protein [Pseudotabrizicola sp.]MDZ7573711.1 DUF1178 family protein [Pseudotabrizicola sp.]